MIIGTRSTNAYLKGIVPPDKFQSTEMDSIRRSILISPDMSTPKKEMFIISSDDVKPVKIRNAFLEAMNNRHEDTVVMFLDRTKSGTVQVPKEIFDIYLHKPSKDDVKEALVKVLQGDIKKKEVQYGAEIKIDKPAEFNVMDTLPDPEPEPLEVLEPVVEEIPLELDIPKEEPKQEQMVEIKTPELDIVQRIKGIGQVSDASVLSKELSAAKVLRELATSNSVYKASEQYIVTLDRRISDILMDPTKSTEERLDAVRAVIHDKKMYQLQNNTIYEQAVENIVRSLVDITKSEIQKQVDIADTRIERAFKTRESNESPNARLSACIDKRTQLLVELHTLDTELTSITSNTLSLINESTEMMVDGDKPTDSALLNSQLNVRYGIQVSSEFLELLSKLCSLSMETSDEFGKMSTYVKLALQKLNALLLSYDEEVLALHETIQWLQANNIENNVVADTIHKRASRLHVVTPDIDSVAHSYMISKNDSLKGSNVLHIDLTGTGLLECFVQSTTKFSKLLEDDNIHNQFTVVSIYDDPKNKDGEVDLNRLKERMLYYARHYARINVVLTPNQIDILDHLKSDVITCNYFIDCTPYNINGMKPVLSNTKVSNTCQRVILVNCLGDTKEIVHKLGILDSLETQLVISHPIIELRSCALSKQDPYNVESIRSSMKEVFKACP